MPSVQHGKLSQHARFGVMIYIYLDLRVLIATCQTESMLLNWIHLFHPFGHTEAAAECHPGVRPNWFSEKVLPCTAEDHERMLYWQSLLRLNIACCNHSNVYFRPMTPPTPPPPSSFSALTWTRHCVGFLSPHSLHRNTAFYIHAHVRLHHDIMALGSESSAPLVQKWSESALCVCPDIIALDVTAAH